MFAAVGRHPNSADGFDEAAAEAIEALAAEDVVRAIGETGLDFFRDRASEEAQVRAFEAQIGIARRTGLPLVIHVRDSSGPGAGRAVADCYELLAAEAQGVEVILHCFSATAERAEEAAERGWHVSFAGNVTYPKSEELRVAASLIPDRQLLVETDSPFLAPQVGQGQVERPGQRHPHRRGRCRGARDRLRATRRDRLRERCEAVRLVRLGQNFLADPNLLEAIVTDAALDPERRGARGRGRGGGADRAARRAGRAPARDRARREPAGAARADRRRPSLGRDRLGRTR